MSDRLSIAEEIIDEQAKTEVFQGQEIEMTTGRVLLHAVGVDGRVLCGRQATGLALIGRAWDARYLPHLPRCDACAAQASACGPLARPEPGVHDQGAVASGFPATGVDVRTAHGTDEETTGAAALRAVIAAHDLRRWMFTDLVTVDDTIRGGFSHPLTISPRLLLVRPACALTTFVHEQLHWLDAAGFDSATKEASKRWPDPPPPPEGCHDAESSWLHLSLCALEYQSLCEIIGVGAATAELGQAGHYSWVYAQILDDPGWFADFVARHGLRVPERPPVPRRYYGEEWWTNLV